MSDPDPFALTRFVEAQARNHADALRELESGRKASHWMWYVFPQLAGLGLSPTARFYGIGSAEEARAYLAHPVLGPRLLDVTRAVLAHPTKTLRAIFGSPDDMKFRSSMTLFAALSDAPSFETLAPRAPRDDAATDVFHAALATFCGGEPDPRTLALLAEGPAPEARR